MTIYDELRETADELLKEFRQGQITLVKMTPGNGPAYDPGPPIPVRFPLQAGVARGVLWKYVTGGLAKVGDLQVTISAMESSPTMEDKIEVDGRPFEIVQIIPKPAAGVPAALVLILRA